MVDEPTSRVGNIVRRIDQIERTFAEARIDPSDPESRERFGDDHLKLREFFRRRESRGRWLATVGTAITIAIATALLVSKGPFFLQLLASVGK